MVYQSNPTAGYYLDGMSAKLAKWGTPKIWINYGPCMGKLPIFNPYFFLVFFLTFLNNMLSMCSSIGEEQKTEILIGEEEPWSSG